MRGEGQAAGLAFLVKVSEHILAASLSELREDLSLQRPLEGGAALQRPLHLHLEKLSNVEVQMLAPTTAPARKSLAAERTARRTASSG